MLVNLEIYPEFVGITKIVLKAKAVINKQKLIGSSTIIVEYLLTLFDWLTGTIDKRDIRFIFIVLHPAIVFIRFIIFKSLSPVLFLIFNFSLHIHGYIL
jgi:hypothetical protein